MRISRCHDPLPLPVTKCHTWYTPSLSLERDVIIEWPLEVFSYCYDAITANYNIASGYPVLSLLLLSVGRVGIAVDGLPVVVCFSGPRAYT